MTVTDTKFFQEGDARDYWTELVTAYGEDIALTRHARLWCIPNPASTKAGDPTEFAQCSFPATARD